MIGIKGHNQVSGRYNAWEVPGRGVLLAAGTAKPSDNAPGYAPGCLFFDYDAAAGSQWYVNVGTKAACNFDAYTGGVDLTTLAATAAELNTMTGIVATAAELNRAADMDTRVVEVALAGSATLAITAALHDQKTIYVLKTDGWNATLPVPVAGMKFRIVIGATIATASTIKSTAGTQIMIGHAIMGNNSDNSVVNWPAVAADNFDTIDLLGTGNSTGGMAGQVITIEAMSATVWHVVIIGDAAGTEATPFANTVA